MTFAVSSLGFAQSINCSGPGVMVSGSGAQVSVSINGQTMRAKDVSSSGERSRGDIRLERVSGDFLKIEISKTNEEMIVIRDRGPQVFDISCD